MNPLSTLEWMMALVIVLNAAVIGASADSSRWDGWIVIDGAFAAAYFFEFFVKLSLLGWRTYFCGAEWLWGWFEMGLLCLAVFELLTEICFKEDAVSGTSLFRILRLLRLSKLLRMCKFRFVADLVMMLNGAVGGLRTLFWSMCMILFPIYVMAIVLRDTLGEETVTGHGAEMFSSLPASFFNVFRCVVAQDCNDRDGRPIFIGNSKVWMGIWLALWHDLHVDDIWLVQCYCCDIR
jgi:hypothetical protein